MKFKQATWKEWREVVEEVNGDKELSEREVSHTTIFIDKNISIDQSIYTYFLDGKIVAIYITRDVGPIEEVAYYLVEEN